MGSAVPLETEPSTLVICIPNPDRSPSGPIWERIGNAQGPGKKAQLASEDKCRSGNPVWPQAANQTGDQCLAHWPDLGQAHAELQRDAGPGEEWARGKKRRALLMSAAARHGSALTKMVLIGVIQIVRKSQHIFDPVENNRFLLIAQVCKSLARSRKTKDGGDASTTGLDSGGTYAQGGAGRF